MGRAISTYRVLPYSEITVLFITTVTCIHTISHNNNSANRTTSLFIYLGWCRFVHELHCGTLFTILWQDGWNPLMFASLNGHVQVVAELIQHGARVDMQKKVSFFTQLILLLLWGILDLFRNLITITTPHKTHRSLSMTHTRYTYIYTHHMLQALELLLMPRCLLSTLQLITIHDRCEQWLHLVNICTTIHILMPSTSIDVVYAAYLDAM